ncbi:MAG: glycerol-3-phosphate 1-O-acyltransferase PlsY [Rubrimonas sp.]|uniref:glycerol-3-phosphate 1-O-acyltransferase PlsY n=1 Tax=Rubrimonas sp. TaxID=2036015 RepID=UPI002FDD5BBE
MLGVERAAPWLALAFLIGYLLGAIPFGVLVAKARGLGDLRAIGSGNIGATNVLRTGDKKAAAATLILDGAKGAVAVLLLAVWGPAASMLAGLGAFLGHLFPVWLRFRGGKGVATFIGIMLALHWPTGSMVCATWLATAVLTRISSASALAAAALAPVWLIVFDRWGEVLLACVLAALIWLKHEANIRRLLRGEEPRISFGRARG